MKRERVYEQAEMFFPGICFECEDPATHRHHIVPEARGGKRFVWLCEPCHEKTHGFHEGHYAMMRAARRELAAQGRFMGGYRIRRRYGVELVKIGEKFFYKPIPREQAIIRWICILCRGNQGYEAMAKLLNTEKIPTATGAPWSRTVVRDLARRGPDSEPIVPGGTNPAS